MSARRYNKGKLRYELLPNSIKYVIEVYTKGAHKYSIYKDKQGNLVKGMNIPIEEVGNYEMVEDGADNWRKGLSWMDTLGSSERHRAAFKAGEDVDPELLTYHLANSIWNELSILEYYTTHPERDDRQHKYLNRPKIGLDIDGVLADFNKAYMEKFNIPCINSWNCHYDTGKHLTEAIKTEEFYLSIPVLTNPKDIPFEPHCYLTSRSIPVEWTKEWLYKNGFPTCPVYSIPFGTSKVDMAKEAGIDWFVDDRYENFVELNNAGICTFLFDASHNQRYEVGYKKIKSLKELV